MSSEMNASACLTARRASRDNTSVSGRNSERRANNLTKVSFVAPVPCLSTKCLSACTLAKSFRSASPSPFADPRSVRRHRRPPAPTTPEKFRPRERTFAQVKRLELLQGPLAHPDGLQALPHVHARGDGPTTPETLGTRLFRNAGARPSTSVGKTAGTATRKRFRSNARSKQTSPRPS